ncbi:MAG: DUF2059 domain-containing protein [Azoarcus sp.]|jgi:hypothetical protein|nr:DUF2059 domain-containing protein [Azoarcus sp.]
MKKILVFFALVLSTHVHADEASRQAKIAQIVEAQGLHQMLQEQLDQSKALAAEIGRDTFRKMLLEIGIAEGEETKALEQVLVEFNERCAVMFSAKELVAMWSAFYGKDLSEADLDKILAYYKSPTGKKDVRAAQIAMVEFSKAMNAEGQKRLNESIEQLISDLKTAIAK